MRKIGIYIITAMALLTGCYGDSWEESAVYRYVSSDSCFYQNFSTSSLVSTTGSFDVMIEGTAMTFNTNSMIYYSDEYMVLYSESGTSSLLLGMPSEPESFSLSLDDENYFIFLEYDNGTVQETAGWCEPLYEDKYSNYMTGIITTVGTLRGIVEEIGDSGGTISGTFSASTDSFSFREGSFSFTRP